MPVTQGSSFVMGAETPQLSWSAFVLGMASTALIHLGETPHPESGQITVDLLAARQSIDVLDLLREKTRGNLTADEDHLFTSVLTDLRVRYLQRAGSAPRGP